LDEEDAELFIATTVLALQDAMGIAVKQLADDKGQTMSHGWMSFIKRPSGLPTG